MRILMLSANTGEGHNSSAKALMEVLQSRGVECQLQDCLAYLSPNFSKFICDWHVRIYQYGGKIFDKCYRFLENMANPENFNPIYELISLGAGKLRDAIMEEDFDGVVCVHPFAGTMITEVRRSWGMEIPTCLVATDYTCSPTVEQCDLDTFFVPAAEICREFELAGIPREKQMVTGIPVRQGFYEKADRQQARTTLQLPQESLVVLVMCGSMGCGPIEQIAEETLSQMPEDSVMVAVCGRNEKLRESMERIRDPRLRVTGFIHNFTTYLDSADLIITKPGGLSSTEAANKHVPMVFINTVGGCESRNFDHFVKKGYAVGSSEPEEVIRIAIRMVWDTASREKMRKTLTEAFYTNTGVVMADHIISAAEEYRRIITE
ncbi:MAG: hypothetical protein J6B67_05450 [Oscillospiraceae bacterium]|nr:hypothetical protein [Oscillospiraceae bacterium]